MHSHRVQQSEHHVSTFRIILVNIALFYCQLVCLEEVHLKWKYRLLQCCTLITLIYVHPLTLILHDHSE